MQEYTGKTERLNLRVEPKLRSLLERAAGLSRLSMSTFVLEAARISAEQRLADQERFTLPPDRFKAFLEALERPPREIPRLRQLLSEPAAPEHDPCSEDQNP